MSDLTCVVMYKRGGCVIVFDTLNICVPVSEVLATYVLRTVLQRA